MTVTSQQAGSIVLGTATAFPANTSLYSGLASTLEASLRSSPSSAFTSDTSFTSQYGPVAFGSFNLVGFSTFGMTAPSAKSARVPHSEGSNDSRATASQLQTDADTLQPIAVASLARIEKYGTYIPIDGYSPPPPPLSPPPPPISPLPPGATAAPTVTATTPTPTPTTSSSSVGAAPLHDLGPSAYEVSTRSSSRQQQAVVAVVAVASAYSQIGTVITATNTHAAAVRASEMGVGCACASWLGPVLIARSRPINLHHR